MKIKTSLFLVLTMTFILLSQSLLWNKTFLTTFAYENNTVSINSLEINQEPETDIDVVSGVQQNFTFSVHASQDVGRYIAGLEVMDADSLVIDMFTKEIISMGDQTSSPTQLDFHWKASDPGRYRIIIFAIANLTWDMRESQVIVKHALSNGSSEKTPISQSLNDSKPSSLSPIANYTVLVYMVASDLESNGYYATDDIAEMLNATSNSGHHVNILIETGGAVNATIDKHRQIDFTKVQRHIIKNNAISTLVDLGQKNLGDPETLTDFITWGAANYPAQHYALLLWDHGGGIYGFGKDDIFNDTLTIEEIKQSLSNSYSNIGEKFELIGFDSCLMATLEVSLALAPYANYLVASEEIEPGQGWDYTSVISSIYNNPNQNGAALGRVITDSYFVSIKSNANRLANYEPQDALTMSVIDLSKVAMVESNTIELGKHVQEEVYVMPGTISLARTVQSTERYGSIGQSSSGHVDLYDFTESIGTNFHGIDSLVKPVLGAIDDAVVYNVHGSARQSSHGISIYMQTRGFDYKSSIAKDVIVSWLAALEKTGQMLKSDSVPPYLFVESPDSGMLKGSIDKTDLAAVYFIIAGTSDGLSRYKLLSYEQLDFSKIFTKDDNIELKWDERILSLCSAKQCMPVTLYNAGNSKNGPFFVPVLLETNDTAFKTVLEYDRDVNGQFRFLGAWPGISEDGVASREFRPLLPGDKIFGQVTEIDLENRSYDKTVSLGPIVVPSDGNVELRYDRVSGDYGLFLEACDFSDNCSISDIYPHIVE